MNAWHCPSGHRGGAAGSKHQGTAQEELWTDHRATTPTSLLRGILTDGLMPGASPGAGTAGQAHTWARTTLPLSSAWNAPLDGMCWERPPVSTGQADGTAREKPSSVSTAIKMPSAATLGRAGDTAGEEVAPEEEDRIRSHCPIRPQQGHGRSHPLPRRRPSVLRRVCCSRGYRVTLLVYQSE